MKYSNRYFTGTDRSYYHDSDYDNIIPKFMYRVFLHDKTFFYRHMQIFKYYYNTSMVTLGKILDVNLTKQEVDKFQKVTTPPDNPKYDSKVELDIMKTKLFQLTTRYEKLFRHDQGLFYSLEGFPTNLDYP